MKTSFLDKINKDYICIQKGGHQMKKKALFIRLFGVVVAVLLASGCNFNRDNQNPPPPTTNQNNDMNNTDMNPADDVNKRDDANNRNNLNGNDLNDNLNKNLSPRKTRTTALAMMKMTISRTAKIRLKTRKM